MVTWNLAPLAASENGSVNFTVNVTADGAYSNTAKMDFAHLTVRRISSNAVTTVRDTIPPTVTITAGPTGATNDPTPMFTFTTGGSPVITKCCVDGSFVTCTSPFTVTPALIDGPHSFQVRVTDAAANSATASRSFVVDTVLPTLNPVVTPNPIFLGGSATVTSGAADSGSGLASQSCDALVTNSVGSKTVTCTATDNAGNTKSADASYSVIYNFTGFFQPVDNLPTVNVTTAGSAVPVKFSLAGNQGLNIFAAGYPASQPIACGGGLADAIEETVTAGGSSVSYDATTGQYKYVWKTEKAWKGTCRKLILRFNDGSTREALFQF